MSKVLILFAHPKFEASKANKALVDQVKDIPGVTFNDLYENYPDFLIDVEKEKEILNNHDIIIWHHPFYWYSCPPLLKQWIDLVLEFNWAYGPKGNALQGKKCLNAITTGGTQEVYCAQGSNMYTVHEFLRPFEQTARLCSMEYLPPFAVMGTHYLSESDLNTYASQYADLVRSLLNDSLSENKKDSSLLNNIPKPKNLNSL